MTAWQTTLSAPVGPDVTALPVHAVPTSPRFPWRVTIDAENGDAEVVWVRGVAPGLLYVDRGVLGSDALSHPAGASVIRSYPTGGAGTQGPPGPQGPQGIQGIQGPAGTDASIPAGAIVMWSGTLASIPSGWALCDGQGGRPDLRDRFIVGAANGANPGTTGGASTHGHTVTQPSDHAALSHTGTAVGNHAALANHAHELPFQKVAGGTGVLRYLAPSIFGTGTSRAAESQSAAPTANTTSAAVELSQAVSAGTPDAHAVTQPSSHAAQSHSGTAVATTNHLPPFYALAFIIKT